MWRTEKSKKNEERKEVEEEKRQLKKKIIAYYRIWHNSLTCLKLPNFPQHRKKAKFFFSFLEASG